MQSSLACWFNPHRFFPLNPDKTVNAPTVIHVAPTGTDEGDGSEGAPLATIAAAQKKIRRLKTSAGLPKSGVAVELLGGRYQLAQPVELTADDSGTADAPITYRARPGEKVLISGSQAITDWKPVSDQAVLERLDPAARGKVYQADLKALGITEYGDLLHDAEWEVQYRHHKDDNQGEATQGDALAALQFAKRTGRNIKSRLELFCNGKPMQISRWPNEGFTHIDKALGETKFDVRGLPGRREGVFSCVDDRPSRWMDEKDAMVRGYWYRDWVVPKPEDRVDRTGKANHQTGQTLSQLWRLS